MQKGLLSVLIVTYNHGRFLSEAIESVIAQSYRDWEIVIVDDGSADNTRDIADDYCRRWPGRMRSYAHAGNKNQGIAASYGLGMRECRGEYIGFLEGDDLWRPGNAETKISALDTNKVSFVFSWVEPFGDQAIILPKSPFLKACRKVPAGIVFDAQGLMLTVNLIPTFSSVMARRSLLADVEFPEQRFFPWLDWWLWINASSKTPFFCIPEELVGWRFYPCSYGNRFNVRRGFWGIAGYEISFRTYVFDELCFGKAAKKRRFKERARVFFLLFVRGLIKRTGFFLGRLISAAVQGK